MSSDNAEQNFTAETEAEKVEDTIEKEIGQSDSSLAAAEKPRAADVFGDDDGAAEEMQTETSVRPLAEDVFGDDDDDDDDDDDEDEGDGTVRPSMEEVFGDVSDEEDDEAVEKPPARARSRLEDVFGDDEGESEAAAAPAVKTEETKRIFSEDFDEESAAPAAKVKGSLQLCLPPAVSLGSSAQNMLLRLPPFIGIQESAFDDKTHNQAAEAAEFERASAVVRWRYVRDAAGNLRLDAAGQPMRESNARIVKFTDGSMQLVVGDAVFDADTRPNLHSYAYLQTRSVREDSGVLACFECAGAVQTKLSLKPSSISSEAHKRIVAIALAKNAKRAYGNRVRMGKNYNPEKTREMREKEDDERIKRERRLRGQSEGRRARRAPAMSADYLEEEDGAYDTVNVSRMKSRVRQTSYYDEDDEEMADFIVKDEEEDDDDEEEDRWLGKKGRLSHRAREMQDAAEDEEDDFDDGDDDEEDEVIPQSKRSKRAEEDDEPAFQPAKKRSKRAVLDDDDDE